MTPLDRLVRAHIRQNGPMDVSTFMTMALAHPEHGYYMTRDPLGAAGDFTTAPEISQLFGEMIGIWLMDVWSQMGCPAPVMLAELGPGRGTLMADILRSFRVMPDLLSAVRVHLVETSPALKEIQKERLRDYDVTWHESMAALEESGPDMPLLLVANEMLDALPVHQYVRTEKGWMERVVMLTGEGDLAFAPVGPVREEAPAREALVMSVSEILQERQGAALFIDYGHDGDGQGDTLQAVRNHTYHPVLEDIGTADITTHVDFSALKRVAGDVSVYGSVTQGAFLSALGISLRLAMLEKAVAPGQARNLALGARRLIAPEDMGTLFRVMALCHPATVKPAGF